MNSQRWIALGGVVALIGLCIAVRGLWHARTSRGEGSSQPIAEEDATPESGASGTNATQESTSVPMGEATATLNPIVEEMMEALGEESTAIRNVPFVILAGDFTTIDAMHQAQGTASIYQAGEARYILRLDPLSVTNGPDLHVMLSPHQMPRTSTEALTGALDLGPLASNTAAQNFDIPAGTDLARYRSVVIYSLSLNVVYTTAELQTVRGQ